MIQELNRGLMDKNSKTSPVKGVHPNLDSKALLASPNQNELDNAQIIKNSPSKQKYIPSRYGVGDAMQSTTTLSKTAVLNDLQQKMESADDEMSKMTPEKINNRLKEMKSYHPPNKSPKVSEFKSKPIKKSESDLLMFKEIFVEPKEKVLQDLREKEKTFSDLFHKGASKQYDKIIGVEKDESKNIKTDVKMKQDKLHASNPKLPERNPLTNTVDLSEPGTKDRLGNPNYKSHAQLQIPADDDNLNDKAPEGSKNVPNERVFFEQQIQVTNTSSANIKLVRYNLPRLRTIQQHLL